MYEGEVYVYVYVHVFVQVYVFVYVFVHVLVERCRVEPQERARVRRVVDDAPLERGGPFSCLTSHSLPSFPLPQTHRRNVGDEYVTENHIFAFFFQHGQGRQRPHPQHTTTQSPKLPPNVLLVYYSWTPQYPQ